MYVYEAGDYAKCPVHLFRKYIGLLPEGKSCKKLYLRQRVKVTPKVWYCDQPYGNNKVSTTVKDLCKRAGFEGKFTNHSLRATSASRMYANMVPEQVIKEVTGHKSDCVRVYKLTCDSIRQEASKVISGGNDISKVKSEVKSDANEESSQKVADSVENASETEFEIKKLRERNKENWSICNMIKNVIKTRMELRRVKKKGVKCASKVAKKLVKKVKKNCMKKNKVRDSDEPKHLVIDVNVNVKFDK